MNTKQTAYKTNCKALSKHHCSLNNVYFIFTFSQTLITMVKRKCSVHKKNFNLIIEINILFGVPCILKKGVVKRDSG